MDAQSYSKLLSYAACELTMPIKKHVYNFTLNDQSSMNHHLLAAATKVVKNKKIKILNCQKSLLKSHVKKILKNDTSQVHTLSKRKLHSEGESLLRNGFDEKNLKEEEDLLGIKQEIAVIPASETEKVSDVAVEEFINEVYEDRNIGYSEELAKEERIGIITSDNTSNPAVIENNIEVVEPEDQNVLEGNGTMFEGPSSSDVNHTNSEYSDQISEFYSDPLLLCSDTDFKTMFRVTRTSFQNLVVFLSKEEMEPIENVPLYKKILIVLWLMGNSGSYSDAAQVFTVTEEAAANCFFDVCATLYNKSDNVIRWPSSDESNEIAARIENNYGFQGVVGILGCHYFSISIPKEALSRREHFNAKKRTYSIALQIVCDDRLVIRDIFPGLPGSIPEAYVLRKSPIFEQLQSQTQTQRLVEQHKHILARSLYPQFASMLTPYTKGSAALSQDELEFNSLHEKVCRLVDQTFGMLQERFLTLKMLDPEVATMVLVAACVLHNICVENNDLFENQE